MKQLEPDVRVRHFEYGTGTVESTTGGFLTIVWDRPPLPGSATKRLDHFLTFAATLELIGP